MRLRLRWIAPLALLILLLTTTQWSRPAVQQMVDSLLPVATHTRVATQSASSEIAFQLSDSEWTEFPLPKTASSLRLITNACLTEMQSLKIRTTQDNTDLNYQLLIELTDRDQVPVLQKVYHFRSRVTFGYVNSQEAADTQATDAEIDGQSLASHSMREEVAIRESTFDRPSEIVPRSFLESSDCQPLSARQMLLNLSELETRPVRVRLRFRADSDSISSVLARCLCLSTLPDRRKAYQWNRLSPRLRTELTQGSVYPARLLSASERQDFARHSWSSLAPVGIEDRDYRSERLFHRSNFVSVGPIEAPEHQQQSSDDETFVVLPIPEEEGSFSVRVRSQSGVHQSEYQPLHVDWYPDAATSRRPFVFLTDGSEASFSVPADRGFLVVQCRHPLIVDGVFSATTTAVTSVENSTEPETEPENAATISRDVADSPQQIAPSDNTTIPPREITARYFYVDTEQSVDYAITKETPSIRPVRIRARWTRPDHADDSTQELSGIVRWDALDENGTVVQSFEKQLPKEVCETDHIRGRCDAVSTAGEWYFTMPSNACHLKVTASTAALVNVATRPQDLPQRRQVRPLTIEDLIAATSRSSKAWFPLQPTERLRLESEGRAVLVDSVPIPDTAIPWLVSQTYDWQQFDPIDDWIAANLLIPISPGEIRPSASAISYGRISTNRAIDVCFQTAPDGHFAPELILLRSSDVPANFELFLNDTLMEKMTIVNRHAVVPLPTDMITLDQSVSVRIACDQPVRCLMNYLPTEKTEWIRRRAISIRNQSICFEVQKHVDCAQTYSVQLFRTPSDNPSSRILTSVSQVQPHADSDSLRLTPRTPNDQTKTVAEAQIALASADVHTDWTIPITHFDVSEVEAPDAEPVFLADEPLEVCGKCRIQLGSDFPVGRYRITVQCLTNDVRYAICTAVTESTSEAVTVRSGPRVPSTDAARQLNLQNAGGRSETSSLSL